ncbi:hypothetical protein AZE42_10081 [Rhizopogon vesiculosus]|uniref:Protein kinase domain-containing protein n=1 Tax=Rhizopogon vesiculosus TaxID=180088 RepID=A0A1J8QNN5_9AGAM|nr:hypothetical protein AZE42_10081 [Rhizopogon vesiculosus]
MYSELVSTSQASWTSNLKGNLRWMAPELLGEREDGSPVRPSKESDTFSFGGIMLQVCLVNFRPRDEIVNSASRSSPTKFLTITSQMMQPSSDAYTPWKNLLELVILRSPTSIGIFWNSVGQLNRRSVHRPRDLLT